MEVIVITSPGKNERELSRIIELFESGLETLHLRKPKFSSKEMEEYIQAIPGIYRNRLVIHGHYDVAFKYGLKGIHLQRRHRQPKWSNRWKRFLFRLKNPKLKISTTFHSIQSLKENKWSYDYVFLSPVFTSHAHYSDSESSGINLLRTVVNDSRLPVFAAGGVDLDKIPVVLAIGFHGVGLSSSLWKERQDHNPASIYQIFKAA